MTIEWLIFQRSENYEDVMLNPASRFLTSRSKSVYAASHIHWWCESAQRLLNSHPPLSCIKFSWNRDTIFGWILKNILLNPWCIAIQSRICLLWRAGWKWHFSSQMIAFTRASDLKFMGSSPPALVTFVMDYSSISTEKGCHTTLSSGFIPFGFCILTQSTCHLMES